MALTSWAKTTQREAFELWRKEYPSDKLGIRVFYSPVDPDASLLILGFNPGAKHPDRESLDSTNSRFEEGEYGTPSTNEMVNRDWDLAKQLRKLFAEDQQLLAESVVSNRFFLKSKGIQDCKARLTSRYREFCRNKTHELIDKVNPDTVLCCGIETYKDLKGSRVGMDFGTKSSTKRLADNRQANTLLTISDTTDPQYIGITHLSGSRSCPNEEEMEILQERVMPYIRN
jgi:hypothetical protein